MVFGIVRLPPVIFYYSYYSHLASGVCWVPGQLLRPVSAKFAPPKGPTSRKLQSKLADDELQLAIKIPVMTALVVSKKGRVFGGSQVNRKTSSKGAR